jgi:hypothetical protein
LETIDLFTEQTLKSGGGYTNWKRFFLLAADAIALKEGCPRVPCSHESKDELLKELHQWWDWLGIERLLTGWMTAAYKDIPINPGENYSYLIETDVESRTTSVKAFSPEQVNQSYSEYGEAELKNRDSTSRTAVLVSAYSVYQLRLAFLSYWGDTSAFIDTLKGELGISDEQ